MFGNIFGKRKKYDSIEPDEILIDSANLPSFDTARLEGKIERPFGPTTFRIIGGLSSLLLLVFAVQLVSLQVFQHDALVARAEANRLSHTTLVAERGLILDRYGDPLAENVEAASSTYPARRYPLSDAAAAVVGYVTYPKQDKNGFWYQEMTEGVAGMESLLNARLSGVNGLKLSETDATGKTVSGAVVREPQTGEDIRLSLDAGLQEKLFDEISMRAEASKWFGGAGVIMDIRTGELLALASYPSFDPAVLSTGEPEEEVQAYLSDPRSPFLDRVVSGLYTPGSVVKPFLAIAALEENIISPEKQILSTGSLTIPNPYDPAKPSVFKDWKAHGWVDMRRALAVSSDVYFYEIGGGFETQPGLGIARIEKYLRLFGFGEISGIQLPNEAAGVIPNPEWKAATFDGERWFLGNTYHTAIGQYGFQATLLQLVRGVALIGNGGTLVSPELFADEHGAKTVLPVSDEHLQIIREGMRMAVMDGTAAALAVPGVAAAGKTGTAEVGVNKELINSFIIGFFPYENPRYAFAVGMEKAPAGTPQGAPAVMNEVLRWIVAERPEMVQGGTGLNTR